MRNRTQPAVYELTIVGTVGPVLRDALRSHTVSSAELHTIVSADLPGHQDLVDLVGILASRGIEIDGVAVLGKWAGIRRPTGQ